MDQENLWATNYKNVAVKMMDGSIVKGKINIGDNKRVSDLLKASHDHFITLVSEGPDGDSEKILILNKGNIVWVEPNDLARGYERTLELVKRF